MEFVEWNFVLCSLRRSIPINVFFFFFSEVEEILASHRDVLFFVSNINRVLNFDEFLFFNSSSFWKS